MLTHLYMLNINNCIVNIMYLNHHHNNLSYNCICHCLLYPCYLKNCMLNSYLLKVHCMFDNCNDIMNILLHSHNGKVNKDNCLLLNYDHYRMINSNFLNFMHMSYNLLNKPHIYSKLY